MPAENSVDSNASNIIFAPLALRLWIFTRAVRQKDKINRQLAGSHRGSLQRARIKSRRIVKQLTTSFVFLTLAASALSMSKQLSPRPVSAQPRSGSVVAETGDRSPLKLPLAKPRIVVKKSKRQLLLFSDGKLLRTYRIGLA